MGKLGSMMQCGVILNAEIFWTKPMRYLCHNLDFLLCTEGFLNLIVGKIIIYSFRAFESRMPEFGAFV